MSIKSLAVRFCHLSLAVAVTGLSGCTSMLAPIEGVPSYRVPDSFLARPQANYVELGLARLSQKPSDEYLLDAGDILGIYIEGILPPAGDNEEIAPPPPVNLPVDGSDLPPSVGYPIPVRDDGTLSLPLVEPLDVQGKSLSEAERLVREAYTKSRKILKEGQDRIIVTLMEERTVRVIVVREDAEDTQQSLKLKNGQLVTDSGRQGAGFVLDLPAYKNDLMHALAETGGLPSMKAKNEVKILRRGLAANAAERDAFVSAFYSQYQCDWCMTPPQLPDDPSTIRIPLRYPPNQIPRFNQEDVILRDGDIVYIEARDTEFFYTGGLLPGGQFPIPRDYDLDIMGAMAISGQGLTGRTVNGGSNAATILGSGFGGAVPTRLFIFRKLANGKEVTISVDLVEAMNDPGQRLLVQAGDTLILRYKPCEEALNFALMGFFTFGVRELLR